MISGKLTVRHLYYRKILGPGFLLWLAFIPFLLMTVACGEPGQGPFRSTGAYPIDIFQEMHYNQTHKAQEPPRLSPPHHSVPIDGAERNLPISKIDAKNLENPVNPDSETLDRAGILYHINCAACHGATANGDGYVGQKFAEHGHPCLLPLIAIGLQFLHPVKHIGQFLKGIRRSLTDSQLISALTLLQLSK